MGVLCEKIGVSVQSELLLFNLRVFTFFEMSRSTGDHF